MDEANTITAMIDEYQELLERKDHIAEEQKRCNSEIEKLRDKLTSAMIEAEVDGLDRNGVSWKLKSVAKYSKKADMDDELFDLLKENGLGDVIEKTVNPQTLQGVVSEIVRDNNNYLPEEWQEVINVYEYMDVSHRKITTSKK